MRKKCIESDKVGPGLKGIIQYFERKVKENKQ